MEGTTEDKRSAGPPASVPDVPPPVDGLFALERMEEPFVHPEQWRDYVGEFGLTAAHVPALLEVVRLWADPDWGGEGVPGIEAPIHAWRALGQLQAIEAVPTLLDLIEPIERLKDDIYLEDIRHVLALIGPAAFDPISAYLADDGRNVFARAAVASGLSHMARRFPDARDRAIQAINDVLRRFADNDDDLNAFLICALLDVKAVESADLIEDAFAADQVADNIVDWKSAKEELDVKGRGIVPDRPRRPLFTFPPEPEPILPPTGRQTFRRLKRDVAGPAEQAAPSSSRDERRRKRKRERKARKRGRRR